MNMWLLWLFCLFLTGIAAYPFRNLDFLGNRPRNVPSVGWVKAQGFAFLRLGPVVIPRGQLLLFGSLIVVLALLNDLTFAFWVGSTLGFLGLMLVLGFGATICDIFYVSEVCSFSSYDEDADRQPSQLQRTLGLVLLLLVMLILVWFIIETILVGLILSLFVAMLLLAFAMGMDEEDEAGSVPMALQMAATRAVSTTAGIRALSLVLLTAMLLLATVTPYTGDLDFNPTYESLNESAKNTGSPDVVLEDGQEVRVISWALATEYLQRAYSDAASTLSTDPYDLQVNTDPAYVNGRFVWVNAPRYEMLKWMGGKEVPFVVSVVNDPQNMSAEGFEATTKTGFGFEVHTGRITWGQRLSQLLHNKYAGELVVVQTRITLDDAGNPWWAVYLGQRHVVYNVITMQKILLVDATDLENYEEYDVESDLIPSWLEVVYPDNYIYDWAKRWGKWREGMLYRFFTKRHLSFPDDTPRFLVLNGTTYWYVPMKQLDSKVLAGYILMDTRTGETTYYNRETKSLADRYTAHTQVEKYLLSGIEGFRSLTIQEGYLYPMKMDTGSIREAYVFPLYSGFTIQQYAIIDAEYYTQEPVLSTNLETALSTYRSLDFSGEGNRTYEWTEWGIENGYIDNSEAAITTNGSTTVIFAKDLDSGALNDAENEWRELRLALSEFERTGNATVAVVVSGGRVVDVDYAEADLVTH